MKKKFLLLYVFFGSFFPVQGQTFTLINIDTLTVDATGSVPSCHSTLQNNDTNGYYVDVIRVLNDTAPKWQTAFCLDVCYTPNIDSARVFLPGNTVQGFVLMFLSDTLPDTTHVLIKFKNVSNPSNTIYQHYYGITDLTFGVNDVAKHNISVKMFPSPVTPGSLFSFNISNRSSLSNDYSLLLFDVYGSKVSHLDGLMNGDNYLSLNLAQGLYVYTLMQDNRPVKSGKLAVSR